MTYKLNKLYFEIYLKNKEVNLNFDHIWQYYRFYFFGVFFFFQKPTNIDLKLWTLVNLFAGYFLVFFLFCLMQICWLYCVVQCNIRNSLFTFTFVIYHLPFALDCNLMYLIWSRCCLWLFICVSLFSICQNV